MQCNRPPSIRSPLVWRQDRPFWPVCPVTQHQCVGGGVAATSLWAQVITEAYPEHAILGEEGGVSGDTASEYLWCARLGRRA